MVVTDYGGTITPLWQRRGDPRRPVDPYAAAALHVLRRHGGKRLIVASNTRTGVDRRPALRMGGVDEEFDAVFQSAPLRLAKPHPEFYAWVLAAAGCRADEVLWVGDNLEKDVIGPAQHGARTALVRRDGLRPREELPAGTVLIHHIGDLVPWLVPHHRKEETPWAGTHIGGG
ncbi:HAD family hydrolase [Spongiactinospora gelatinilytica]|uniref:HAD family hydrolase n=1 Tax=Spongiactinospora gelatinilytica TaxID=2666298 RepID=UPI001F34A188|nr:HAD family hydrolase [Spongiactinospora gelatinilytica]